MAQQTYRGQDRYGMAVVVAFAEKVFVAGGPELISAYAGEVVRWTLINTTKNDVKVELTNLRPAYGAGPADPFEEGKRWIVVPRHEAQGSHKAEIVLKVKPSADFKGQVARYHYEIQIQGQPGSTIDPDLDIWP
jgi:hypothetical protein